MQAGRADAFLIRTPDQRLRVFVSSTLEELADERRVVREAIEALRLTPVMFELGARPYPPRAVYRAYLAHSDVFIGLYWQRYGWIAEGEQVSGLEDEYRLSGDRPKLIYVKVAERREDRLEQLLERVRSDDQVSYRRFGDAAELRALVADDLALLLTERFDQVRLERSRNGVCMPPQPPTSLVGRESEVEAVAGMLCGLGQRLVTLVGPGGIGKTRLALAVAHRAEAHFPDGVAYADLAGISEPQLVMPALARAVGLTETGGTSIGMVLREALKDRGLLIVVDNMERLVDAAPELVDLLTSCHRISLLITSRSVLNINCERVFRVDPLELPPAQDGDGVELASVDSVRLFLDRAEAVAPEFHADARDLSAIAAICRLLDGVPLAIELASARIRLLPPSELLRRMGHRRLSFLASGPRDLPPRQRALRDTIELSHGLLSRDGQRLFRRLAVFVGSADLDAIERVTNEDGSFDVLSALGNLLDVSLVGRVESSAEPRFGMLETIREFAVERLEESGEAQAVRARHEAHYLELAEAGREGITSGDQLDWLRRIDRDEDNFRAIFRRALRRGDAVVSSRLGVALIFYWLMRSRLAEGRRWMDETAVLPGIDREVRSTAWTLGAALAFFQGDLEHIESGIDRVLADARDGRRDTFGYALVLKGFVSEPMSAEAERFLRQGMGVLRECDEAAAQWIEVSQLYLLRMSGRYQEVLEAGRRVLADARRRRNPYYAALASGVLAVAALHADRLAEARAYAAEALTGYRELDNRGGEAFALDMLAAIEVRAGQVERASRLFGQARHLGRLSNSRHWRTELALFEQTSRALRDALGYDYEALFMGAAPFDLAADLAQIRAEAAGTG